MIGSASWLSTFRLRFVSERSRPPHPHARDEERPTIRSPPNLRFRTQANNPIIADQDRTVLQLCAFDISPTLFHRMLPAGFDLNLSRTGPPGSARRTRILPRFSSRGQHSAESTRSISLQICRRHFRLPGQHLLKSSPVFCFPAAPAPNAASVLQGTHPLSRQRLHAFPAARPLWPLFRILRNARSSSGVTSVISRRRGCGRNTARRNFPLSGRAGRPFILGRDQKTYSSDHAAYPAYAFGSVVIPADVPASVQASHRSRSRSGNMQLRRLAVSSSFQFNCTFNLPRSHVIKCICVQGRYSLGFFNVPLSFLQMQMIARRISRAATKAAPASPADTACPATFSAGNVRTAL